MATLKTETETEKFDGYRPTFKDLKYSGNRVLLNIGLGIVEIGEDIT